MGIGVVGFAVVALLLFLIVIYNGLIGKRNKVTEAFAAIDVQLKKRFDLIPNLVSTVREYMEHERGTLEKITELRARAMTSNVGSEEKIQLSNEIQRKMGGIMVAVENYPDLKANTNFLDLQASLNEVESQLSAARRSYNAAVTGYNNAIEMFPGRIFASSFGFHKKQVLETAAVERENVDIKQLFNN